MLKVKCPQCDTGFSIEGELKVGQLVSCPHCNRKCEVVWLYPPELSLADEGTTPKTQATKPISG